MPGFNVVEERDAPGEVIPHPSAPDNQAVNRAAAEGLALALKALGQRAASGLSSLFTGAGLGVACYLWDKLGAAPTTGQLVALGMYGVFFLALEWIRRR